MTPMDYLVDLAHVLIAAKQVCRDVTGEGQTPQAQEALQRLEDAVAKAEGRS